MGHQKLSHLYTRLHVGVLENAQATNEKLLKLLISGGNRFAIGKIAPGSFPLLFMLV